jgi:hypothetical protein
LGTKGSGYRIPTKPALFLFVCILRAHKNAQTPERRRVRHLPPRLPRRLPPRLPRRVEVVGSKRREPKREKKRAVSTILYGHLAQALRANTEAAMFAEAVVGAGDRDMQASPIKGEAEQLPKLADATSGKHLKQEITMDMTDAARFGKEQCEELRRSVLQCFIADLDTPFYTRFPKGHPDEFCNGVRQAMKWRKLLYGKGNASRGLSLA